MADAFQVVVNENGGAPSQLLSDNGKEFLNRDFQAIVKRDDIFHMTAEPGDHNALGVVDRLSKTLKDIMYK